MLLTIKTTVNAPIEKVWDCWNLPEHIVNWNFASPDWHAPRAANDLRPGGKLQCRMEARDGSFGFDFEATYDAIELHRSIDYRIADGRKVQIRFETTPDGILITESFEAEGENSPELQQQGWQAILDNFRKYVESLRG